MVLSPEDYYNLLEDRESKNIITIVGSKYVIGIYFTIVQLHPSLSGETVPSIPASCF